jgi:hypothetical protein
MDKLTLDQNLIGQHKKEKQRSIDFKDRRFKQWNDNYSLYRDSVVTNRLTQRQAINIPIIRETLQTWISKIDEAPMLEFESRGKDNKSKDGEIILNELWAYYFDKLGLDIIDNLEKKVVGLQGRGFKKWGWAKNEIFCDLIDPYDIDIDPNANPLDLDSAHFVIHKNIFKPLRVVLANPKYSEEAKKDLKTYLDSKEGLIASAQSKEDWDDRNERLQNLGATNYDEYRASDVIVEINENYKLIWNEQENRFVRHLIVIASDNTVLYNKPLKEAIGIDFLPIVSWMSDPDLNDQWPDGIADNVRTFNKVVNMYISQDLENRTYRNFGMYFFNTLSGTFQPRSFDPKPFGMYGVPGNPSEIVQQMRIEPLNDTAEQITFLKDLIQSSVAQTPTERGVQEKGTTTLGEVQLSLQQSTGRNEVVAKNYRRAWKQSGVIFYELLNANSKGAITLYKKGSDGNFYSKEVSKSDWMNHEGYECKVVLKNEKTSNDDLDIKKAQFVIQAFPENPVAQMIAKRKLLETLDWDSDEIDQVFEQQQAPEMPLEGSTMPQDASNMELQANQPVV